MEKILGTFSGGGIPIRWWREKLNRLWNSVRSRVEHVFGVLKSRFGWRRVRFRGLRKNAEYAYAAVACVNLYQHRHRLLEYLEGSEPAVCFS